MISPQKSFRREGSMVIGAQTSPLASISVMPYAPPDDYGNQPSKYEELINEAH